MSDVSTGARWRPWSWPRRIIVGLSGAMVLLVFGGYIGLQLPWGTKHPRVAHGVAMLANDENDLVMFDADDGMQLEFGANHIRWAANNRVGSGNPPCLLTPQRKVEVQIGFLDVAGPDGGSRRQAVWVKCPDNTPLR